MAKKGGDSSSEKGRSRNDNTKGRFHAHSRRSGQKGNAILKGALERVASKADRTDVE